MPRLSSRLLNWYRKNKRTLPWRVRGLSPYAVWVSEIMLQQTRVETVIPYYEKWLQLFPTVEALASASEREVLNAWEGLGYYSRARNFHKAAMIVVQKYDGELPRDLDELQKLPGIGRYTVGALAAILFRMDEPALDGNLKRVYARLFDVGVPVDSPAGEKLLWQIARENLPKGRAADFNQALMDLGALICLPKNPRCLLCPVMNDCQAHQGGKQAMRPVKTQKKETPHHTLAAAVIVRRAHVLHTHSLAPPARAGVTRTQVPGSAAIANLPYDMVLLVQRPATGLLGGMWEFPNGRVTENPAGELAEVLKSGYNLQLGARRKVQALGVFQHAYTHFKVTVHAFVCELRDLPRDKNMKWVALGELIDFPMGKIDRLIANTIKERNIA